MLKYLNYTNTFELLTSYRVDVDKFYYYMTIIGIYSTAY